MTLLVEKDLKLLEKGLKPNIKEMRIFGSYTNGKKDASDVDVLIKTLPSKELLIAKAIRKMHLSFSISAIDLHCYRNRSKTPKDFGYHFLVKSTAC